MHQLSISESDQRTSALLYPNSPSNSLRICHRRAQSVPLDEDDGPVISEIPTGQVSGDSCAHQYSLKLGEAASRELNYN